MLGRWWEAREVLFTGTSPHGPDVACTCILSLNAGFMRNTWLCEKRVWKPLYKPLIPRVSTLPSVLCQSRSYSLGLDLPEAQTLLVSSAVPSTFTCVFSEPAGFKSDESQFKMCGFIFCCPSGLPSCRMVDFATEWCCQSALISPFLLDFQEQTVQPVAMESCPQKANRVTVNIQH